MDKLEQWAASLDKEHSTEVLLWLAKHYPHELQLAKVAFQRKHLA